LDEITPNLCKEWADGLHGKIASHYYNNSVATLRLAIAAGIKAHKAKGGENLDSRR